MEQDDSCDSPSSLSCFFRNRERTTTNQNHNLAPKHPQALHEKFPLNFSPDMTNNHFHLAAQKVPSSPTSRAPRQPQSQSADSTPEVASGSAVVTARPPLGNPPDESTRRSRSNALVNLVAISFDDPATVLTRPASFETRSHQAQLVGGTSQSTSLFSPNQTSLANPQLPLDTRRERLRMILCQAQRIMEFDFEDGTDEGGPTHRNHLPPPQ